VNNIDTRVVASFKALDPDGRLESKYAPRPFRAAGATFAGQSAEASSAY